MSEYNVHYTLYGDTSLELRTKKLQFCLDFGLILGLATFVKFGIEI
jgi:hypothetical protein